MGKVISGQGADGAYNYRNFNILCERCEVSEGQKSDILEYFLYNHAPADDVLLKHFAALKVFYTNIFLTKDTYNGKMDVARIVLNNCREKGLLTIIDPGCHTRSRAEKFMREYRNNRAVLIESRTTDKLDIANMVRVDDYGLKFYCRGRGMYLIQRAMATEFVYSAKGSYNDFLNAGEPVKPPPTRAVAAGSKKQQEMEQTGEYASNPDEPNPDEPNPDAENKDEGRILQFPVEALKQLTEILVRQELTSSARMVKILVSNYSVIVNELKSVNNKRVWLEEHYYVYTLLDNSAEGAYKQLEKAAGACDDAVKRYEALKNLSACKPAFINVWNACLRSLEQRAIRVLPIRIDGAGFIVTKNELKDGWELRNTEGRRADEENPVNKVYGVIQHGVLVENEIARRPILNVYTD
ncbi:MAG: hypothetical protein LBB94_12175 [Clostridiales bacterium]|jgi:hypothetical protein|nr:hypothetical protein [Clostridiales bacterium]